MSTSTQDKEFLKCVIGDVLLEAAIGWIGKNMDPPDVFGHTALKAWAEENGYKEK